MQVLDDEQHRRALGKPLEQAEQRLEQPGLHPLRLREAIVAGAERRHEAGRSRGSGSGHGGGLVRTELDRQVAQDLDERPVRQAGPADVDAIAAQHAEPASAASRATSLVNRVLPTPASPATSRWSLAAGGAIERALDRVELGLAADEDRAADAGRHGREDTREPGGSDNRHTSRASG